MAWFRNHSGRPVYAAPGGLERAYVARGYQEIDEAEALVFVAEHRARAQLTPAEKTSALEVIRDESPTRAMRRATMAEKPKKPRRRRK